MTAVKKVEKSEIINAAFGILRENGFDAINARSLAKKLNCSTKPIYFQFENMERLKKEMKALAEHRYVELFESCKGKFDNDYIASGMAYLKFAREEKHLFRYLYLSGSVQSNILHIDDANYNNIIQIICERYKIDEKQAKAFHYDMAIYSYGLAVMINTGYRSLTDNEIGERLNVQGKALRSYYLKGDINDNGKKSN